MDNESKINIGDIGEDFVEHILKLPIGEDFMFRGQEYLTDKGHRELCDLLIYLGDTAILIEIKTADRTKVPGRTDADWVEYANDRLEKTLKQHSNGVQALRTGAITTIQNERQGKIKIDAATIKHIYCISIVDHPTLDKWGSSPSVEWNGEKICVLTTTHSEIINLFTELSTPLDLIDYLQAREQFLAKHPMMGITELDLLAAYKPDPDLFLERSNSNDLVMLCDDLWDGYSQNEARRQRVQDDVPSYLVDDIINALHRCDESSMGHIRELCAQHNLAPPQPSQYAKIANGLVKIRRLDRRQIGLKLLEKSNLCLEQNRDRYFATMPDKNEGTLCLFLVSQSNRKTRSESLISHTISAVYRYNRSPVIGIAIPPITETSNFNIDAFWSTITKDEIESQLTPEMIEFLPEFQDPRKPNMTEFRPQEE